MRGDRQGVPGRVEGAMGGTVVLGVEPAIGWAPSGPAHCRVLVLSCAVKLWFG